MVLNCCWLSSSSRENKDFSRARATWNVKDSINSWLDLKIGVQGKDVIAAQNLVVGLQPDSVDLVQANQLG